MNFAIAILLLTLSKPVDASAKATKEAQGSRSSGGGASSLEAYSYKQPPDFTGVYHGCFASATRTSATNFTSNKNWHLCNSHGNEDDLIHIRNVINQNITKKDDFGAYMASGVLEIEEEDDPTLFGMIQGGQWQGQALGNTLFLSSYGEGIVTQQGIPVAINDTPDKKECKMFQHEGNKILECFTTMTEYCGPVPDRQYYCEGKDGKWLNTYTFWSVLAQDSSHCPSAPVGFCESNRLPAAPAPSGARDENEFDRRLKGEADQVEEEQVNCPLLQGK